MKKNAPRHLSLEITLPRMGIPVWILLGASLLVPLIGLLGYASAVPGQETHTLLTRARWQALQVHRQTLGDYRRLQQDLEQMHRVMAVRPPDPVATMLLAQRIRARHRAGAVPSTAARQALMRAAELAVQVSHGDETDLAWHSALREAERKIHLLQTP